jgi:hypothetical protein
MKPSLLLALATSLSITLVTTASAQGPNPPGVNPQHYECYDVVDSIPRLAQKVELRDQFGASATVTARAMFLCNPVSKNNGRITDKLTHFVCYEIRPVKFAKWVATTNQFGVDTLAVRSPHMLCVPSLKTVVGP